MTLASTGQMGKTVPKRNLERISNFIALAPLVGASVCTLSYTCAQAKAIQFSVRTSKIFTLAKTLRRKWSLVIKIILLDGKFGISASPARAILQFPFSIDLAFMVP
jgi:hypothetical protein